MAGQTPAPPSAPTPEPVAPSSLPSIPATAPGVPAQTPAAPAQSATPAQPASNPQQQAPAQPANPPYSDPLQAPVGPPPSSQAPAAPSYTSPLDAPIKAPPSSSGQGAATPNYTNPLQTPVTVQPAQPGQPAPVTLPTPAPVAALPAVPVDYNGTDEKPKTDHLGSAYIPVDSVVYPMALRLYSMGYLDTIFISMRPWTRRSLLHALETSEPAIMSDGNEQAEEIYAKLMSFLAAEDPGPTGTPSSAMTRGAVYGVESLYGRAMGITGLSLRDSYHLGQTIVNDYGRAYQPGFNAIAGFSTLNEWNRFSLYVRGEYQHAPSAPGYNLALSSYLSGVDEITFAPPNEPQATIPYGPIAAANPFRLQEAVLSFHWLGHEFSGGKSDAWLGPGMGGAMAWSNNAENIYSFRINRVEPLHIPYFSYLFGGLRYDFFVGALHGHTYPRSPWVHSEIFSLRPTDNFEFSFQRTVIWGGHCAACYIGLNPNGTPIGIDNPVTLGSFFRSFFSFSDTEGDPAQKLSTQNPGARFSDFSFSWRLPYLRKYVTLYTDSEAHDDVSPISAPRRAAYRPGVYLSQFPKLHKLDLRVEGSSTDCSTLRCNYGVFQYFEGVQKQGYTNNGFIFGDWIGREAKGGNAWLTYHLSADEWVQLSYLHKQTPQDFIVSGTTQNQYKLDILKRLTPDLQLDASYQYERWVAPVYKPGPQHDSVINFDLRFYPKLHTAPKIGLNGKIQTAAPNGVEP